MFTSGDIRAYGVLSNSIDDVWEEVKPLLQKAVDYADGKYAIDDIYKAIVAKEMQLWAFYKSHVGLACIIVTQINYYPQSKRMGILFLSSDNFEEILPFWALMSEFGRAQGCDRAEICGRPGWEKMIKHLGFKKTHTVLTAPL